MESIKLVGEELPYYTKLFNKKGTRIYYHATNEESSLKEDFVYLRRYIGNEVKFQIKLDKVYQGELNEKNYARLLTL